MRQGIGAARLVCRPSVLIMSRFAIHIAARRMFGVARAPRQLSSAEANGKAGGRQGSVIRSAPSGRVYVFWQGALKLKDAILAAVSDDGGRRFGRPFLVGQLSPLDEVPGASFRVDSFPTADIDNNGNVFVAWTDNKDGHGVITLAKSANNGGTSSLSTAADVPDRSAFYPALAASGKNVFIGFNAIDQVPADTAPGAGVVYYDAYYVLPNNSGTSGSFSAPVQISATPSDPDASTANSLTVQFIGDYNGAAAGPDGSFWFSWTDTRNAQPCADVDDYRAGDAAGHLLGMRSGIW